MLTKPSPGEKYSKGSLHSGRKSYGSPILKTNGWEPSLGHNDASLNGRVSQMISMNNTGSLTGCVSGHGVPKNAWPVWLSGMGCETWLCIMGSVRMQKNERVYELDDLHCLGWHRPSTFISSIPCGIEMGQNTYWGKYIFDRIPPLQGLFGNPMLSAVPHPGNWSEFRSSAPWKHLKDVALASAKLEVTSWRLVGFPTVILKPYAKYIILNAASMVGFANLGEYSKVAARLEVVNRHSSALETRTCVMVCHLINLSNIHDKKYFT